MAQRIILAALSVVPAVGLSFALQCQINEKEEQIKKIHEKSVQDTIRFQVLTDRLKNQENRIRTLQTLVDGHNTDILGEHEIRITFEGIEH